MFKFPWEKESKNDPIEDHEMPEENEILVPIEGKDQSDAHCQRTTSLINEVDQNVGMVFSEQTGSNCLKIFAEEIADYSLAQEASSDLQAGLHRTSIDIPTPEQPILYEEEDQHIIALEAQYEDAIASGDLNKLKELLVETDLLMQSPSSDRMSFSMSDCGTLSPEVRQFNFTTMGSFDESPTSVMFMSPTSVQPQRRKIKPPPRESHLRQASRVSPPTAVNEVNSVDGQEVTLAQDEKCRVDLFSLSAVTPDRADGSLLNTSDEGLAEECAHLEAPAVVEEPCSTRFADLDSWFRQTGAVLDKIDKASQPSKPSGSFIDIARVEELSKELLDKMLQQHEENERRARERKKVDRFRRKPMGLDKDKVRVDEKYEIDSESAPSPRSSFWKHLS